MTSGGEIDYSKFILCERQTQSCSPALACCCCWLIVFRVPCSQFTVCCVECGEWRESVIRTQYVCPSPSLPVHSGSIRVGIRYSPLHYCCSLRLSFVVWLSNTQQRDQVRIVELVRCLEKSEAFAVVKTPQTQINLWIR